MPEFQPNPPQHGPEEDDGLAWVGYDHPTFSSEQFIVTDNPVVAVLLGPKGELLAVYHERDDRFGFGKWAEDR